MTIELSTTPALRRKICPALAALAFRATLLANGAIWTKVLEGMVRPAAPSGPVFALPIIRHQDYRRCRPGLQYIHRYQLLKLCLTWHPSMMAPAPQVYAASAAGLPVILDRGIKHPDVGNEGIRRTTIDDAAHPVGAKIAMDDTQLLTMPPMPFPVTRNIIPPP